VPIVPSRSARIQDLLGRLASGGPAERDSAVAGLTLLGARVVEPLRAILPTANRAARLAAVEVLERLDDRAAIAPLLDLVRDEDEPVALRALEATGTRRDPRAVEALTRVLAGPAAASRRRGAALALVRLQAAGLVEALDPLAARLLDEREEAGLRVAILDALEAQEPPLAPATLRPLLKRLAASVDPQLAARAHPTTDAHVALERLVDELVLPGRSAEAVARASAALAGRGAPAIPALLQALERLGPLGRGGANASSLRARAAIHEALAALDSRVALYDLRETIESGPRAVMPALLRAAGRVGDGSLVPVLARVVAKEVAPVDACAEALAAIVAREKLRKTSAACKSVRPDDRSAFLLLWEAARASRPR
jgi:HEAT repeat protein